MLNNNQTTVKFPVVKGECMIDLLTVPANAEGRNGQEYVLKFNFELDSKQRHNVAPYNLPFVFYNGKFATTEPTVLLFSCFDTCL